jgi:hypothetical membrane protein
MTTLRLTLAGRAKASSDDSRSRLRRILLGCGVFSSLLYVATDIISGLRYEGYSFTSQAISELMAVGAPSEALVDPLFLLYGVLAAAFGVGVMQEGSGRTRLRVTGALLSTYAIVGFTGPLWFAMNQRGTASGNDLAHILVTAVLVLFLLLAVSVGAKALGNRFRAYSSLTLLIVILFGTLSAPFGARLADGQPTPGFGLVERVPVYAFLLWVAVLATALLRRRSIEPQPHI